MSGSSDDSFRREKGWMDLVADPLSPTARAPFEGSAQWLEEAYASSREHVGACEYQAGLLYRYCASTYGAASGDQR
jgi:hypothetical protein